MLKSKIKVKYEKHNSKRICQGDILRDFSFYSISNTEDVLTITLPYIIVLSQDCDLESFFKTNLSTTLLKHNQFLPNLLFLPAFPDELLREGKHLEELYGVTQDRISSEPWKCVKANRNERYHYFEGLQDRQIPDFVIDFKHYFSLPIEMFISQHKEKYLATINELFRERLSQRFSHYLSRIGLPEIEN